MAFTKEQLIEWANKLIEETQTDIAISRTDAHAESYRAQLELIEMALAGMGREPVAYIADCGTIVADGDPFFDDYKNPRPLYDAPQLSGNYEHVSQPYKLDGWIKCSERMPEHSKTIIITEFGEYWTGYFDRTDVFWCDETKVDNVTHWMPLPAAPKED